MKLTNNLKIRSTAKNSIVTYNAIQKVYKSRFDDLRSNVNIKDFYNSFTKYPFISEKKSPYEEMLTKNKEFFYNNTFFTKTFQSNFCTSLNYTNTLNSTFLDLPFLLSLKSDASRYL
jgi:hypothetical protein